MYKDRSGKKIYQNDCSDSPWVEEFQVIFYFILKL